MRSATAAPVTIRRLSSPGDWRALLASDVRSGMDRRPRTIPSKYFYDEVGSALFDRITRLPEYYLTRLETFILAENASDIMRRVQPAELIELGAGSAEKTRTLLDAMLDESPGRRYMPFDISQEALEVAVRSLCEDYPDLAIDGLIGDYDTDLTKALRSGRRLISFLGSTIGNMTRPQRVAFYRNLADNMADDDWFLLGVDLVKDPVTLVAAYDDSEGVTAEFTRNILTVVNRELGADFPVGSFVHRPVWNAAESRMEAWLEAPDAIRVTIPAIDMTVDLAGGERIHSEISHKFTQASLRGELAEGGLAIGAWYTDPKSWYAVVLATRRH